jgi:carbon-monoxide dehydrogenase large subunit
MSDTVESPFEKYAIGQSVARSEDPRLLRGDGLYSDDFRLDGQAYGYVFRSPFAHGVIQTLNVEDAKAAPGVLAVLTAADMAAANIGPLPNTQGHKSRDGAPMLKPDRPVLATDKVQHRGEAVALVVAESAAAAKDASELIEFDVEMLPAVSNAEEAMADGAPQMHGDVPNNVALDWEFGDAAENDKIFAGAHHIAKLKLRSNRVVVASMEPRAATAEYDAANEHYTLHVGTQGVFGFRNLLAARVLGVERDKLRVRTYDVGGSFGMKSGLYPEYAPLLVAARLLGRPVKWCDERSDSMLSDQHGRDSFAEASLAFDAEGHILAGRVSCTCNLGAYLTAAGPNMHTGNLVKNFPGVYRLPNYYACTKAVFTNTTPIGAYRGAGRPEGVYYMERLMDNAAREMGMDRVELRRRNLVRADEMPYAAVSKFTYDSGDFPGVLTKGLARADWDGFEGRRAESAKAGKLRGLGIACYLEVTGPPSAEMGGIKFEDDGTITMTSGSQNYGQGHASTFAQILVSKLGVPFEQLRLDQGDSDKLLAGSGTGGSKTVITAGSALVQAAEKVIENGRIVAGHVLETATADIEFDSGAFRVTGTDRSVDIMELSREARTMRVDGKLPEDAPDGLDAAITAEELPPLAFPNGCHIVEVEIDPETGTTQLAKYVVVDDFGVMINPMLVEGQVHGGIAQGVGQALMENVVYDDDGQPISGTYMDYTMPRAEDFPDFEFASHPVPATTNVLGAKGCGEAGTSGALPAVMNAIVDVLQREKGVHHFDMPATPERVWSALNG